MLILTYIHISTQAYFDISIRSWIPWWALDHPIYIMGRSAENGEVWGTLHPMQDDTLFCYTCLIMLHNTYTYKHMLIRLLWALSQRSRKLDHNPMVGRSSGMVCATLPVAQTTLWSEYHVRSQVLCRWHHLHQWFYLHKRRPGYHARQMDSLLRLCVIFVGCDGLTHPTIWIRQYRPFWWNPIATNCVYLLAYPYRPCPHRRATNVSVSGQHPRA